MERFRLICKLSCIFANRCNARASYVWSGLNPLQGCRLEPKPSGKIQVHM